MCWVSLEGTSTLISTNFEMSAFLQVKAIDLAPLDFAATTAFIQFCEDPLVVNAMTTSPGSAYASTCLAKTC